MVLPVELPLVLFLRIVSKVTLVDRDDKGIVGEKLREQPAHPESLVIEGRIIVAYHRKIIAAIVKVEVVFQDARELVGIQVLVTKQGLHPFDYLGHRQLSQTTSLNEVGDSILDFASLMHWYLLLVEILQLVGAQTLTCFLGLAVVDLQSSLCAINIFHTHPELLCNLGRFHSLHVLHVHHQPLFLKLLCIPQTIDVLLGDELF